MHPVLKRIFDVATVEMKGMLKKFHKTTGMVFESHGMEAPEQIMPPFSFKILVELINIKRRSSQIQSKVVSLLFSVFRIFGVDESHAMKAV